MDDDGIGGSGLGALASFQLGRWSAESSQKDRELFAHLTGRAPVPVNEYNQAAKAASDWRTECLRLREVVAQLQAENVRLEDLANRGLAARDKWKAKYEHQFEQTLMLDDRANRFKDELERLKGNA